MRTSRRCSSIDCPRAAASCGCGGTASTRRAAPSQFSLRCIRCASNNIRSPVAPGDHQMSMRRCAGGCASSARHSASSASSISRLQPRRNAVRRLPPKRAVASERNRFEPCIQLTTAVFARSGPMPALCTMMPMASSRSPVLTTNGKAALPESLSSSRSSSSARARWSTACGPCVSSTRTTDTRPEPPSTHCANCSSRARRSRSSENTSSCGRQSRARTGSASAASRCPRTRCRWNERRLSAQRAGTARRRT